MRNGYHPRVEVTPALPAVLVIDDEIRVRRVARRVLERAGYEVIEAETGREGLTLLRERDDVAVVLLDVGLTDMSGIDLARQITDRPSRARVIISSGYDLTEAPPGTVFLRKPYGLTELVECVAARADDSGVFAPSPKNE